MSKTKKTEINAIKNTTRKSIFFGMIAIIIILIGLFSTLQTKVSTRIYPESSQVLFRDYYNKLINNNNLDAQEFWQFREFYSPGFFRFDRGGIDQKNLNARLKAFKIKNLDNNEYLPFLMYSSDRINSLEYLTLDGSVDKFVAKLNLSGLSLQKRGNDYRFYRNSNQDYLLVFVLSNEKMKKANGFFDYQEKDVKLIENKYWAGVVLISSSS